MSFPWPQWTDRLKELRAAGYSATYAAFQLEKESGIPCNRNKVIGALHRIGLTSRGKKSAWTPQLDKSLTELWPQGLSLKEIEKKLGISDTTILKRVSDLRLPPRAAKPPKAPRAKFNPFRDMGKNPPLLPPAPPLSPDQKEYILGKGIILFELKPDSCRWPINEPAKWETWLFCGNKKPERCPYCPYHARMAYGRAA